MIEFTVKVDDKRVKGDLRGFRLFLDKLVNDVMKQEACLTARAALKYAPPLVIGGGKGDTAAAGKMGERAIDKDVRAIFAPPGATLPAVFAKGTASGAKAAFVKWRSKPYRGGSTLLTKIHTDPDESRAFAKANNLFGGKPSRSKEINNTGQMRVIHEGQRKNGRVVREGRPSREIKRYPYIVKDALIKRYVKERAKMVGQLKSGWWEIISKHGRGLVIMGRTVDAGAKGLPKYITRHSGNGILAAALGGSSKRITITNSIGDNDGAGLRTKTLALVLAHRTAAIAKRPYQYYADRMVRNWNNQLPPGSN